jgi:hypothetical protein
MVVMMVKLNPELAKSTAAERNSVASSYSASNLQRTNSNYSDFNSPHHLGGNRRSLYDLNGNDDPIGEYGEYNHNDAAAAAAAYAQDDDLPVGHHFTFIPPNPKKFYQKLVEYCLVADLEVMLSPEVDDNDEVSLGILSPQHIDLISECALRWRIAHPYRAVCFLDLVKQFYERNDVPMECIPEAMHSVQKVMQESDPESWPVADVRLFACIPFLPCFFFFYA